MIDSDSPAEQLLLELGITEPEGIELEVIACDQGVTVNYRDLVNCEAQIVGVDDRAIVTVNRKSSDHRQRFSLAHELGHWHYHRGQILTCRTNGRRQSNTNAGAEREADAYAAELLLPRYLVEPRLYKLGGATIRAAKQLSKDFRTSITATLIRLVEVGPEPALLVCYGINGRRWFVREPNVPSHWFPKYELDPRSDAFQVLSDKSSKVTRSLTRADMWFDYKDAARHDIYEESISLSEGEVLAVLVFKRNR